MTQVTRTELLSGVHLTAVHTTKFKSCLLGMQFLLPLDRDTASLNALVPSVLQRGSRAYPDMEALSAALDDLYGGAVEPKVRKRGETLCVGFVGSFLDDAYTLDGSAVLEPAANLMGELLLHPLTEQGAFRADYVEGEKRNLISRIRAQMNDKRQYAYLRVVEEMCSDEPFGVDRLGDEKSAETITPETLYARYQSMLAGAQMELYYCGSATPERVGSALLRALEGLPHTEKRTAPPPAEAKSAPTAPKLVEECLDVTQGKLTMGLRTGGIDVGSGEYPALMLANALFGGTTTSKLFMNVRERLSLCYYASSALEKHKGIMVVSSGVEFDKVEEAKTEILAQLAHCKQGHFDEGELEAARRSVVSACKSTQDAQARLEDYWQGQAVAGQSEDAEALAFRLEQVTREQVIAAVNSLTLDTIYFLKGKEA